MFKVLNLKIRGLKINIKSLKLSYFTAYIDVIYTNITFYLKGMQNSHKCKETFEKVYRSIIGLV